MCSTDLPRPRKATSHRRHGRPLFLPLAHTLQCPHSSSQAPITRRLCQPHHKRPRIRPGKKVEGGKTAGPVWERPRWHLCLHCPSLQTRPLRAGTGSESCLAVGTDQRGPASLLLRRPLPQPEDPAQDRALLGQGSQSAEWRLSYPKAAALGREGPSGLAPPRWTGRGSPARQGPGDRRLPLACSGQCAPEGQAAKRAGSLGCPGRLPTSRGPGSLAG